MEYLLFVWLFIAWAIFQLSTTGDRAANLAVRFLLRQVGGGILFLCTANMKNVFLEKKKKKESR
jgi:hypothetical protein